MTHKIIDRIYTEDFWRSTTYQRPDGTTFRVGLPPIRVMAAYGKGKVFLDHMSYNEEAEEEMVLRLNQAKEAVSDT